MVNELSNRFVKIAFVLAAIVLIAAVYNTYVMSDLGEKIDARQGILDSMAAAKSQATELAKPQANARISIVLLVDSSEKKLVSLEQLVQALGKFSGIEIASKKELEIGSSEAALLMQKYNVQRIPAMLLSGETDKAAALRQAWASVGSIEDDGTMVLRNTPPIYFDVNAGKLRGETGAVFLAVPDSNEVFDAVLLKQMFGNAFGLNPVEEKTFDYNSSEGMELISAYGITKVPTIILSGDLNVYAGLVEILPQIGSIESDGNFVFRNLDALQGLTYFDLNKNQAVAAEGEAAADAG